MSIPDIDLPQISGQTEQGNAPASEIPTHTPEFGATPPGPDSRQVPRSVSADQRGVRYQRPELRNTPARRAVPVEAVAPLQQGRDAEEAGNTYIWGTNISASSVEARFERFMRACMEGDVQGGQPKYLRLLKEALDDGAPAVNISGKDLRALEPRLHQEAIDYPREVLSIMDEVVARLAEVELGLEAAADFQIRLFEMEDPQNIRDLDPSFIDKIVTVHGMVTRTSSIIPDLRMACFVCEACGYSECVNNENGIVKEPTKCSSCGKSWVMKLVHNRGTYLNKQVVKMQENPANIPEGETPHSVSMYAFTSNVDLAKPGDRVIITGLYRVSAMRVNPRQRVLLSLYKTYIDVLHISCEGDAGQVFAWGGGAEDTSQDPNMQTQSVAGGSQSEPAGVLGGTEAAADMAPFQMGNMSREELRAREAELIALSREPNIMNRLIASLAPNVWHLEGVKKGVLCQLFGGTTKYVNGGKIRGELNVLIVGDPSVSKSQLLSYVHDVAPRGIYTSGRGSSAVGLTAYVTRDPESGELVLESGALVLSDRGICCIDEFDKMSDSARSMLHEVMEQQTVSVAKAGLISTLNARTSVLACANPVNSRYNPALSLVDNINLPPTLLSRFDLLYLVLDERQPQRDMALAKHLVRLFHAEQGQQRAAQAELLPAALLRDYVAYARARCHPVISDEAADELVRTYQNLRRMGRDRRVVSATPRQLESLIRISEALARATLSPRVTAAHVVDAQALWHDAFSASSRNAEGELDIDMTTTGVSGADKVQAAALAPLIRRTVEVLMGRPRRAVLIDAIEEALRSSPEMQGRPAPAPGVLRLALLQLTELVAAVESKMVYPARAPAAGGAAGR